MIQFDNVTKRYQAASTPENLSFKVKKGEMVFL